MTDHLDVLGTGSAGATPDVVALDARIQTSAGDVAASLAALTSTLDAAFEAAAAHGVEDADRRTTGMGLTQDWDRDGREITGFRAHQSFRLLIRDRRRVGEVIAALAEAAGDALGVDGISLEVADREPLLVRARAAAFADAQARATQYASLAERGLGPVLRIEEEPEGGGYAPMLPMAAMSRDAGMPVAAGESLVGTSIRVRFALTPE